MNRTGLAIALATAVLVGVVFAVYPQLDLDISAPFYRAATNTFVGGETWMKTLRNAARVIVTLIAAPAILALTMKFVLPTRPTLMNARAAWFLVLTLALGPGLIANTLLKDHWARARPANIVNFGGEQQFTPWWDPRGQCPNNCSFVAGEPAGAFWTLGPAALAPPQWRVLAYAGALLFGAADGALRIAGGGHFFTDVVFAGVMDFLVLWVVYALIYRGPLAKPLKPGEPPKPPSV
jgi:lipid A 4'-phosphatase